MLYATTIHDLPNWRVSSFGNGLSYVVFNKPSGEDIFFQGDDAAKFREEFEALTTRTPALDFSDALHVIWQEYGK